uniref:Evasin n=1 Tax=Rhipicephalus zambeziensis TaxID=60191 RepID=A0A224Y947_9ACAR
MKTAFILTLAFLHATSAQTETNATEAPQSSTAVRPLTTKTRTNRTLRYGIHFDERGCMYKVLGSGHALFPVSCHAWCPDGRFYTLPNLTPCLQIADDFAERSFRSDVRQCIRGVCFHGVCASVRRRMSCHVPTVRKHCWDDYGNYYLMRR